MTPLDLLFHAARLTCWSVLLGFSLFVFFAAVMALRDARDRGVLVGPVKRVGYVVLAIGYALDCLAQLTIASVMFGELPPRWWFRPGWTLTLWGRTLRFDWLVLPAFESTVSARTKRLKLTGTGWRQARAIWWRTNILGPLDSSGAHS